MLNADIIKLLLNPLVKGISGGGYLADNNFSIFDLSENDLKTIQTNKPNLIADQLDVSPVQAMNAPDFIRKQYYDTIVKNNRGLEHLLQPDGTLLKGDLDAWDAGWYQIKLVLKAFYTDELREFNTMYKQFEDRMRPLVYELGFYRTKRRKQYSYTEPLFEIGCSSAKR